MAVGHLVIGNRVFHKIKFIKASFKRGIHKVPSPLPLTFKPIKKSLIVIFRELEIFSNVVICDEGGEGQMHIDKNPGIRFNPSRKNVLYLASSL